MASSLNFASPTELILNTGFAHSAATTARVPIVINGRVLIPLNTAAANERNAFAYACEIDNAPAESSVAWNAGDALYWDATNAQLTKTSTGNTLFGHALQPKATTDTLSPLVAFNAFA
jgi:Uncharacterized conserved protein (DUF2190).